MQKRLPVANHNLITMFQCPNPIHSSNALITYRLHRLEISDARPTNTGFPGMNWLTKESDCLGGCDANLALYWRKRDYIVAA